MNRPYKDTIKNQTFLKITSEYNTLSALLYTISICVLVHNIFVLLFCSTPVVASEQSRFIFSRSQRDRKLHVFIF